MAYEEKKLRPGACKNPTYPGGAQQPSVSGVEGVERFDENTIVMDNLRGRARRTRRGLHIGKLSLDGATEGRGAGGLLSYEERRREGGFFSRLFR
jgi:hypothetical protein